MFAFVSTASAVETWDVSGTWDALHWFGGNYYNHVNNIVQASDDSLTGNGGWDGTQNGIVIQSPNTWDITDGLVTGNVILFDYVYTSVVTCSGKIDAVIALDGSMIGTWTDNCGGGTRTGDWTAEAGTAVYQRSAEILTPIAGENVYGLVDFTAYLNDNDVDSIQWAVREGTCAAGTNTVFGNVDGHSDVATVNTSYLSNQTFSFTGDMTGMEPGMYCFIYNPVEDSGESNIRLTRQFNNVAVAYVHGGGQLIKDVGPKPTDDYKISFGGWIWDLGLGGYTGDWEVNFHNVEGTSLDKSKFHTTSVTSMNFYTGDGVICNDAMNFSAVGEWNGLPGYKLTFRAGDFGSPNTLDTVRIELRDSSNSLIYDTFVDFGGSANCVGSARTSLDNGNITIWQD